MKNIIPEELAQMIKEDTERNEAERKKKLDKPSTALSEYHKKRKRKNKLSELSRKRNR